MTAIMQTHQYEERYAISPYVSQRGQICIRALEASELRRRSDGISGPARDETDSAPPLRPAGQHYITETSVRRR